MYQDLFDGFINPNSLFLKPGSASFSGGSAVVEAPVVEGL
jgi:hypothetical protein